MGDMPIVNAVQTGHNDDMTIPANKPLPAFESEAQEREFWESNVTDAMEYFDPASMLAVKLNSIKPSPLNEYDFSDARLSPYASQFKLRDGFAGKGK